jgi:Tol biopolymer transport system component
MKPVFIVICLLCVGIYTPTHAQKLPLVPGQTLLITSVKTGDTEIFATDPVSGTSINLTNAPASEERYPAWSPDGKKIVFTSNRQDVNTYDLYVADANGGNLKPLTRLPAGSVAYWPSFTADGKYIYFNEGKSSMIYRIGTDGSNLSPMAEGRDGNISPDGKKIVFTQKGNKGYGVWVMDANGANRKQVVSMESEIGGIAPVWSNSGKKIAFSGQVGDYTEIFVCEADGSNLQQLTRLNKISSSPAFSRDDQYITFRVTDEAYWRDAQKREKTYGEKEADKRPVWLMKSDGSEAQLIEVLRFQCAMDGSRAEWKPMAVKQK